MGAQIIEAQPDYLTVTTYDGARTFTLEKIGKQLVDEEAAGHNKVSVFERWGYKGNTCGRITWGLRKDGGIIQIAGELSAREFPRLYPLANHVTRIDLAVTARYDPPDPDLARRLWDAWDEWSPDRGFDLDGSLIQRRSGGSTLYVGSRQSERFARVYDKHAESRQPSYVNCWRWEVELKSDLAQTCADRVAGAPHRDAFCSGYVFDHFSKSGIQPDWDAGADVVRCTTHRAVSSAERTRAWLQSGVRPAVNRLRGWGLTHEVLDDLGLNPNTLPKRPGSELPGTDHHGHDS